MFFQELPVVIACKAALYRAKKEIRLICRLKSTGTF
jgi:hypothetical protein